jgi:hypothetical protein
MTRKGVITIETDYSLKSSFLWLNICSNTQIFTTGLTDLSTSSDLLRRRDPHRPWLGFPGLILVSEYFCVSRCDHGDCLGSLAHAAAGRNRPRPSVLSSLP